MRWTMGPMGCGPRLRRATRHKDCATNCSTNRLRTVGLRHKTLPLGKIVAQRSFAGLARATKCATNDGIGLSMARSWPIGIDDLETGA